MLQHGSILVDDDQPMIAAISAYPVAPPAPAATLTDTLDRTPNVDEVAGALFDAVRSLECADADELTLDSEMRADMARAVDRYRDDLWTWRR